MFKFLKGLKSAIATKPIVNEQILFETDSGRLLIDNATTRLPIKDPSAAKSISYANHIISLKDADANVLSTVDISSPTQFYVDLTNGHLYYQTADDIVLASNLTVPGNVSVGGDLTMQGDFVTNGTVTVNGDDE